MDIFFPIVLWGGVIKKLIKITGQILKNKTPFFDEYIF